MNKNKKNKKVYFFIFSKHTMNLLKTNLLNYKQYNNNISKGTFKHFPVSTREWNNSIYVFNKNALNLIPIASLSATNIIKSYFSLFNSSIENKLRTERLPFRFRKLSKNKIFVGNSEFKHTNDKVVINLYLFNRQRKTYNLNIDILFKLGTIARRLKKRVNRKMKWFDRIEQNFKKSRSYYNGYKKQRFFTKLNFKKKLLGSRFLARFVFTMKSLFNKIDLISKEHDINKYLIIRDTNHLPDYMVKILLDNLDLYFYKLKNIIREKELEKLQLYFYYKQLLSINKLKYSYSYLRNLKKYLQALFEKNVEFNLINLERFYLSSDILTESIKLKLTKNRRSIFRHLKRLNNKIKIKEKIILTRPLSNKVIEFDKKKKMQIQKYIVKNLKYKSVSGFRLEAKGRLTRRHTASRSVTKVKYKGNLLNMDSSYRGFSTVLLKGNLESNLQYTKLKSKTRIGSFGLKGWVNGN